MFRVPKRMTASYLAKVSPSIWLIADCPTCRMHKYNHPQTHTHVWLQSHNNARAPLMHTHVYERTTCATYANRLLAARRLNHQKPAQAKLGCCGMPVCRHVCNIKRIHYALTCAACLLFTRIFGEHICAVILYALLEEGNQHSQRL